MSDFQDSRLPDLRYIRELAKVFKQYELDEIEIETGDQRVLLRRSDTPGVVANVATGAPVATHSVHAASPASVPAAAERDTNERPGDYITSPFVGTFYRAPRPESPNFVELGDSVQPGRTLCIVEAMKLFNEIEADFACIIEEALVESGQPVEYGAKLFKVRRL